MNQPLYFMPKGVKSVTLDTEFTDGYQQVILVEATGTVSVTYRDDTSHTFTISNTPAYMYGDFKQVNSSGTTVSAANLFRFKVGIE